MVERPSTYFDSNVFIDALEGEPDIAEPAQELIKAARDGRFRALTSELTLAEILVRPKREHRDDLVQSYISLLDQPKIVLTLPISREILVKSVDYRVLMHPGTPAPDETRRNFLPDAIHVVTAIEAGATTYVGRDARIRLPAGLARVRQTHSEVAALLKELR